MGWKDWPYPLKGFTIGGLIGGLIDIICVIILVIFLLNGLSSQPGSMQDKELMLFIIAVGVILGAFIIFIIFSGIGALIGWIYGKIKKKKL